MMNGKAFQTRMAGLEQSEGRDSRSYKCINWAVFDKGIGRGKGGQKIK